MSPHVRHELLTAVSLTVAGGLVFAVSFIATFGLLPDRPQTPAVLILAAGHEASHVEVGSLDFAKRLATYWPYPRFAGFFVMGWGLWRLVNVWVESSERQADVHTSH